MRWYQKLAVIAGAVSLIGAAPAPKGAWTRAWTASVFQAPAQVHTVSIENTTIRSAVRLGAGGSRVRLRLSNEYGKPFDIGAVTVRVAGGPAMRVTFDGQSATRMPEGAPLVSDPVSLPVKAFDVVEVSIYFPGKVELTTVHLAPGQPTAISAPGDHSGEDFAPATTHIARPLLAGIDVLTPRARPIVVAYGDSITDNTGCANDAVPACRWGDVLGRRLATAGKPHVVVTQAISGNRVLASGTGPSALARLDRDVLAMPGVSHIVLLEGINDIGASGGTRDGAKQPTITAEQLIQAYRQLVTRAHDRGIKVIALTVLPYQGAGYYSEAGEAIRERVNDWMRTSGTFDAVVDMEKVVADPADPKKLNPALQRGDNLHPDGRGETKMGEAIPLGLFK